MRINSVGQQYNYKPAFKSEYIVDCSTAISRQQLLTMGMLFSNFWMYRPRETFNQIKYNSYGRHRISFKDGRDNIVEKILKDNSIGFQKVEKNI
ncbi:MAG: hypothetical protein LBJ74_02620 [Heliobacteriaceae bacterium]|nr:hypothetical protein [Heliobacteriaceae bacterium]